MTIIDFRSRPNTREYLIALESPVASTVMRKLGSPHPVEQSVEQWVDNFTALDVKRVVFTGRQSDGTTANDIGNDYVSKIAHQFPDTVIGFAGINPLKGIDAVREVERSIDELDLKGVSIDPFGGLLAADDRRIYPVYAKCAEVNVPVVVTCGPLPFAGPNLDHGDVRAIDRVASDFPDLTLIIDHCGWPWVTETIAILLRHENVFVDLSLYPHLPGAHLFAEAANTMFGDRFLFASCFPIVPVEKAIERVAGLPFSPEALEGVMSANAERLLSRLGCISQPAEGIL